MFLMAQDNLDQNMGDGLDLNLGMTLGCLWGIFCTDLVQDLEYQVRPYEVLPGQTEAVVKESIEYLYEVFRRRPAMTAKKSVLWHLTTPYFARAMREVRRKFSEIEVDRLRVKPKVKITGEFYLQTVEGDPNYNIHRWLEAEGAEVYPAAITIWMDYLLRLGLQRFELEARSTVSHLLRVDAPTAGFVDDPWVGVSGAGDSYAVWAVEPDAGVRIIRQRQRFR